jgi:hypothetical protein
MTAASLAAALPTTQPISLLQQTLIEFGVIIVGSITVSLGALWYFRRVRMERPPIGTFNGRDVVILMVFVSTLPFLYAILPNFFITCLLVVTFTSSLYIGYRQLLGTAGVWLGIGLLIGLNIWTSHNLIGTVPGWQLWWAELSVLVGLGAVAISNLYVQGGMKLRFVAWLALGLGIYDLIFATILPLTDRLVASYLSHPLDPLLGMRFGIDNFGLGLGDVLIFSMFLIASYKAYGPPAARIAFAMIVLVGGVVTSFVPFLLNFLDAQLDLLVPAQSFFGPAAFLCYLWMKRRYGRERTMAEYWASPDSASRPARATHPAPVGTARPEPAGAAHQEPAAEPAPEPASA